MGGGEGRVCEFHDKEALSDRGQGVELTLDLHAGIVQSLVWW